MPRLPRSTSLTFALVFGFLSVLTIFGVSSGGLKADTQIAQNGKPQKNGDNCRYAQECSKANRRCLSGNYDALYAATPEDMARCISKFKQCMSRC